MQKLEARKAVIFFIALCSGIYFCSYIVRINFVAIIVDLIANGVVTKTQAATITTVSFITYGVGQLVSGVVGDKISPRWLIFIGLLASVLMNILMPIASHSFIVMSVIWGVNGVAQAFMWPPLTRIMVAALNREDFNLAMPYIGVGSGGATVVVYAAAPLIISLLNWRYVFYIFAGIAFVISFVWIFTTGVMLKGLEYNITSTGGAKKEENNGFFSALMLAELLIKLLPVIIITIAIQGILRDGITTWMPFLMSERFGMKSSASILTAVALPVFHIVINLITYKVLMLFKDDIFVTITVYFGISAAVLLLMLVTGMNSVWLTIFLLSTATGVIHGINLLQTSYIPRFFAESGSVSTISGVLNFSTYVGSSISTYLFAVVSDKYGWNVTVVCWVIFSVIGGALTAMVINRIKKSCAVTG